MSLRLVARIGFPPSPLRRFMIGSFAAHLLATVLIVALPSLRSRPRVFNDSIRVELVAGPPARQPAPAAPRVATPPPPKKETEGPRVEAGPVKPAKKPPKKTPPQTRPEPPQPAAPTPEPADLQPAVEDRTPGAVADAGGAVSPMEGLDDAFAWYRASVTAALYGHWQRPFVSGLTQVAETRVVFDILRDGTVRNLRVENSSGIPALDRSALRAVSEASPLPPLPASWQEPALSAGFIFQLFPE